MRKIILSVAILIVIALIFGPFAAGFWLQKKYYHLVSFYNSADIVHIKILDYQRKWFTSDTILEVSANNHYLRKFFADDEIDDFPLLIVKQHIRNGLDFNTLQFPEIIVKERGEQDIRMTQLTVTDDIKTDNQFFNANAEIKIHAVQLEDQKIGPIEARLNLQQLNRSAMDDLITIYHDFIREGELYQGQLREKIRMVFPKILDEASVSLEWKIPKKSVANFIHVVSAQPDFIRDVAEPDHNQLLDMRNQMEFALHRNELFIDYLSDHGYISNETGDTLISMQKQLIPLQDYAKKIKDLFLSGNISLVVSYQLCWQYAQIIGPYQWLEARAVHYQKIAEKQIQAIFNGFVKKGYVGENDGDYFSRINWSEKSVTSNGVEIK